MRKLIQELPYERLVASGRYQYRKQGVLNAYEIWRLTDAAGGYRFLRVDLNAMATTGNNYLFHLTLSPEGWAERLSFRHFRKGYSLRGDLLLHEGAATLTRIVNGERYEEEVSAAPNTRVWFPSTAGLAMLAQVPPTGEPAPALTLDKLRQFVLWPTEVRATAGPSQTVAIMGRDVQTTPLTVSWADQQRTLFLDESAWPVRMEREGVTSWETRLMRPKRITGPAAH